MTRAADVYADLYELAGELLPGQRGRNLRAAEATARRPALAAITRETRLWQVGDLHGPAGVTADPTHLANEEAEIIRKRTTMAVPTPRVRTGSDGPLHDIDSAAVYLRCGRRLIYRLVAERKLAHTYAGRSLRFWQSDLDTYLDARAVEPVRCPDSVPGPHRSGLKGTAGGQDRGEWRWPGAGAGPLP